MSDGPKPGEDAPEFDLLAAGSGRRVSLEGAAGRKLVLVFHMQNTAPAAREINRFVRESGVTPEEAVVASVIDLSIVPPVYWMTVHLVLDAAYQKAAAELPAGADPEDYVAILPDWSGLVSRRYGAKRTGSAALAVVVDEGGQVAGRYQGGRPAEAVLEMLGRDAGTGENGRASGTG